MLVDRSITLHRTTSEGPSFLAVALAGHSVAHLAEHDAMLPCRSRPSTVKAVGERFADVGIDEDLTKAGIAPPETDLSAAVAGYELGPMLGRGAFGVVYAARHIGLGRDVAIKQLWPDLVADDVVRRRFATEARLLASLDHPHVVRVYDYVEGDVYALVMERMGRGTLADRLRDGRPSPEWACAIALAALYGLEHAHQRGVLHRDIKPQNLLFGESGVVKVADFGMAKVIGSDRGDATATDDRPGTPAYMAPEQVNQALGQLSPSTDVWAVGAILYEMLAGQRPFTSEARGGDPLILRLISDSQPLHEVRTEIPEGVSDVVAGAIARVPAERFQTASAFAEALEKACSNAFGTDWHGATRVPLYGAGEHGDQPVAVVEIVGIDGAWGVMSCPGCMAEVGRHRLHQPVRVLDISQVEAGWLAHGRIETGFCPSCGQALRLLARYVPVECAGFSCPKCHEGELRCEVVSVTYAGGLSDYDFEARLSCPKCGAATSPRRTRLNKPLRWLRRVRVGPSGIEVESLEDSAP
jgi:hypothetical protein